MVAGHTVGDNGRLWELKLREGLLWHDGERVLARDCVASIRRWAARDAFGDALMKATDELSAPDDRTIRFRLSRPFPLLPYALAKPAVPACFMMPERIANTDPFKAITEVVGSGPYRFKADERVPGAFNAYERFAQYKPLENGVTDWTSGPKIVHYDRVEWKTMPDTGTAAAALQAGEVDWQEVAPHDLLPVLNKAKGVATRALDHVRLCLHDAGEPPAAAVRQSGHPPRAARRGGPVGVHDRGGRLRPGLPGNARSAISVPARRWRARSGWRRSAARATRRRCGRELKAAGYNGEKVVVLVPADSLAMKPLGDVAAGMLREVGMDVEYVGVDYGTLLTRRNRKTPVAEGGWSAFSVNWQGIDWLNPAGHIGLRGDGGYPGWYVSEKMESLRAQWLLAEGLAEQQRICREIEQLAVQDVPYYPLGLYRQPTAHRSTVAGILSGTAVFWNVHPA